MVRSARFVLVAATAALGAALVSASVVQKAAAAEGVKAVGPVLQKSVKQAVGAKAPVLKAVSAKFSDSVDAETPGVTGGYDVEVEPETSADLLIPESADKVFMDKVKEAAPKDRKPMLDMLKNGNAEKVEDKLAKFKENVLEEVMEADDEEPESSAEEFVEDEMDDDVAGLMDGDDADADDFEEDDAEFDEGADEFGELDVEDEEYDDEDEDAEYDDEDEDAEYDEDEEHDDDDADDFIEDGALDLGVDEAPGSAAAVAAAEAAGPDMSVEAWEEVKDQAKEDALALAGQAKEDGLALAGKR